MMYTTIQIKMNHFHNILILIESIPADGKLLYTFFQCTVFGDLFVHACYTTRDKIR